MWFIEFCHFRWARMTPDPDFKDMPLFDVECLRKRCETDPRTTVTTKIESELCSRQRPSSTFKVISVISFGNKCSLLFRSLTESRGDQMKDIAYDFEWHLKVIWCTVNSFIVCVWKNTPRMKSITTVRRHIWPIISTVVFERKDCCLMLSTTC